MRLLPPRLRRGRGSIFMIANFAAEIRNSANHGSKKAAPQKKRARQNGRARLLLPHQLILFHHDELLRRDKVVYHQAIEIDT